MFKLLTKINIYIDHGSYLKMLQISPQGSRRLCCSYTQSIFLKNRQTIAVYTTSISSVNSYSFLTDLYYIFGGSLLPTCSNSAE